MLIGKMASTTLSLFCLTSISCSIAHAEPKITSIEGNISNLSVLTLKGEAFGSGSLPILWDTTDNQPYSNKLSDKDVIPTTDSLWSQNGSTWANPIVLNKTGDLRSKYRRSVYSGVTKGFLGWPRVTDTKNQNTLYVSWWFKAEGSISSETGSNKVIRVWDSPSGKNTRVSWTQHHLTADNETFSAGSSWKNWGGVDNKWNRLEIWLDSNNNILKAWTNGEAIHSYDNFRKSNTTDDSLTVGLIGFDPNVGQNYSGLKFHFSDIYASRSIARVELSNSPTWTTKNSIKEIQPPIAWSNSEIKVRLNPGTINPETAYIYIVDSNGNANNNGYPICSSCPKPPQLLIE